MRFDNKQFEQGCKESMETLDKLKKQIDSMSSGESLSALGKAANNIDLNKISDSVESLNKRFSILGIAGMTAISEITKAAMQLGKTLLTAIPNQIKSGGWTRAMNIEQAKFQLEGLGITWDRVGRQISNAVADTAYGLDAAAKAASQLAASGVQIGKVYKDDMDEMEMALKAISGVAAQTNSSYEDISNIFTTVAGNGRLMGDQLRQLSTRGMNAAAAIGKALGVTEAEVREMVSHSEISFKQFSEIMYNTFGENAFKANETFSGSLQNMLAALSRTGEKFAGPIQRQIIPVFNALRQAINGINDQINIFSNNDVSAQASAKQEWAERYNALKEIQEAYKQGSISYDEYIEKSSEAREATKEAYEAYMNTFGPFEKLLMRIQEKVVSLIPARDSHFWDFIVPLGNALVNIGHDIGTVFNAIGKAWYQIFGKNAQQGLLSFAEGFERVTNALRLTDKEAAELQIIFQGVFSVMDLIFSLFTDLISAIFGVSSGAATLREKILFVGAAVSFIVQKLAEFIKSLRLVKIAVGGVKIVLGTIGYVLYSIASEVWGIVDRFRQLDKSIPVLTRLGIALEPIANKFKAIYETVKNFVSQINVKYFDDIKRAIASLKLPSGVTTVLNWIVDRLYDLKNILGFVINLAVDGIGKLTSAISKFFGGNDETITKTEHFVEATQNLGQACEETGTLITIADEEVAKFGDTVQSTTKGINAGTIAAVALAAAFIFIAVKIVDAIMSVSKALRAVQGTMYNLKRRGLLGLLMGTGEVESSTKAMQIAQVMMMVAASITAIGVAYHNYKDELVYAKNVFIELTGSLLGAMAIMTALQQWLYTTNATSGLRDLMFSVVEMAAAVALLTASMLALAKVPSERIRQLELALLGLVGMVVLMEGAIVALGIVAAKYGAPLAIAGGSLLAMAASVLVLVKGLEALSDVDLKGITRDKLALLTKVMIGLVSIGAIAALVNSQSILKIATALLAIEAVILIAKGLFALIDLDAIREWYNKLSGFDKFLLGLGIAAAAAVAIVATLIKAKEAATRAAQAAKGTKTAVEKLGTATAGIQKAIKNLSLVPLIGAITTAVVTLGAMVVILGKTCTWEEIGKGLTIIGGLTAIITAFMVFSMACKKAKAGPVLAITVALVAFCAELAVLTMMINNDLVGTLAAIGMLAGIMAGLYALLYQISKINFDKNLVIGLGEMIGLLVVITGSLVMLSYYEWDNIKAGVYGLSTVMGVLAVSFLVISKITVYPDQLKILALGLAEILAIGVSLSLIARHPWENIRMAIIAMGVTLTAVTAAIVVLNKMTLTYSAALSTAVLGAMVLVISVGASLALVASNDWHSILAASLTMGLTLAAVVASLTVLSVLATNPMIAAGMAIVTALLPAVGFAIMEFGAAIAAAAVGIGIGAAGISMLVDSLVPLILLSTVNNGLYSTAIQLLAFAGALTATAGAGITLLAGLPGIWLLVNAIDSLSFSLNTVILTLPAFLGEIAQTIPQKMYDAGAAAANGFKNGFISVTSSSGWMNAIRTAANSLHSIFCSELQIHSPSKVTMKDGMNAGLGQLEGYTKVVSSDSYKKAPKNAAKTLSTEFTKGNNSQKLAGASAAVSTVEGYLEGIANLPEVAAKAVEGTAKTVEETTDANRYVFFSSGQSVVVEMEEGMEEEIPDLVDNISGFFHSAGDTLGDFFGGGLLDSVSGYMDEFQKMMNSMQFNVTSTGINYTPGEYHGPGSDTDYITALTPSEWAIDFDFDFDEYTEGLSGLGDAAGGAASQIKTLRDGLGNLSEMFTTFSRKSETTAKELNINIASQIDGINDWARSINKLYAKGLSKEFVDSLKAMGTESYAQVKAWEKATTEEVIAFNEMLPSYLQLSEMTADELVAAWGVLGDASVSAYSQPLLDFDAEFAAAIQAAIDPFAEFDKELDITKYNILDNLQSQVDGVTEWSDKLLELSGRTIDDGLLQHLKDMGPAGYKYVMAFSTMTDDELQRANELWQQTMNLGIDSARKLWPTEYEDIAANVTEGYIDNLDTEAAYQAGMDFGQAGIDGTANGSGTESPSWKTAQIARWCLEGYANAIEDGTPKMNRFMADTAQDFLDHFQKPIEYKVCYDLGTSMMDGMAAGITDHMDWIVDAARSAAEAAYEAARNALKVNSPSKRFIELGSSVDEGFAKGITDYSYMVSDSVTDLSEDTIQQMQEAIQNISDNLNAMPEFNPVITPRLDLTEIQNEKYRMGNLFGNETLELTRRISNSFAEQADGINQTSTQVPSNSNTIIFNQTNNSPKNIDPYESYRLGRLSLAQMKGALT